MKGDVGMSKEGMRRCLHQDTNSFITPSLHLCSDICLFVVNALGKEKNNFTLNWLYEIHCGLERNKDVGMGL